MVVLESCAKHTWYYLDKTNGNTDFHEIINFLTRSSIHYALTVSPVVSTTFVEQFWMSAKSKIINNVRYITAKVAGKPVTILEASIRSDLLFDDADGIDSMHNQAIFDVIQLMGNVPVPLDHFPINALTSKVFSFMVKKGKHFSGNVTPLALGGNPMLVQPTEDEGEALERQSEPQPTPSSPYSKGSGGNHGGQSSSDRSLSGNEDGLTLQSVYDLCVSLCKQVTDQCKKPKKLNTKIERHISEASVRKPILEQKSMYLNKEEKPAKAGPTVHKDPTFDDLDNIVDDATDYMESEDAQDEGRTRSVMLEEKESTDKPKVSTDKPEVSTAKPKEVEVSTDKLDEEMMRPLLSFLVSMSQNKAKQKGVEIKDDEDSDRPRATSTRSVLTLKPLPKIDPKDKGKKVLEEEAESDAESEGVVEAERKFDQLAKDEEIAIKVQEDWEAEEDIQARIEADKLLAARLQEEEREMFIVEEREMFIVEERAKFLYDTITAQRRFLSQQRVAAIRSRPPTRTQLRNQMMTYLKHGGGKKHAELKDKNFEEIQVLYKNVKRLKKRVVSETSREEDTATVPVEQEVTEQGTKKRKSGHVKMITRKRPRPQPDDDSDHEHIKCLRIVTFDSTIDSEIMETKSFVSKLHKVSSPDGDYLVVYKATRHCRAFNYLMEVLQIFDRQDLFHLYDLVMKRYSEITPEGIELVLWGDLKIMMESLTEENDQELKDGTVIYMLVERRYPLSKELLQRMLDLGLEVKEESTAALHLQMNFGKDKSNLLIVDSLLKTIRLSIHLVVYNEELAIPEQTATGKGISNPLMAGSLPKTTKPT
ncbi:hypothetical protein Tco_0849877 [Tanacetum coccineum]